MKNMTSLGRKPETLSMLGMWGLIPAVLLVWLLLLHGAWWAPWPVALLWAFTMPTTLRQYLGGLVLALVGYALPLAVMGIQYPLGHTANLVAAIMGFGRHGLIVWALTALLPLLLGLSGAWVGHALRNLRRPSRVSG